MIRGFVEKSYDLLPTALHRRRNTSTSTAPPTTLVITAQTHAMRRFAVGTGTPASDPFKTFWIRDYRAIMYVNKFLNRPIWASTPAT